uniref:SFRICE_000651 n=1 Tax=Spodoptera frugiperda TaxID=7108 RepID=A0A2H1WGK1_SPOFR
MSAQQNKYGKAENVQSRRSMGIFRMLVFFYVVIYIGVYVALIMVLLCVRGIVISYCSIREEPLMTYDYE